MRNYAVCRLFAGAVAVFCCLGVFADPIDTTEIDLEGAKIDRTGITVSESTTVKSGYDASKVLDGGLDDAHRWIATAQKTVLTFVFTEAKVVNSIGVHAANWAAAGRSPKDWAFYGSDDGVSWTKLDEQTNQTSWTANLLRVYSFSNKTAYTYYKFDIAATNGDSASLAEFWFYNISISHLEVVSSLGQNFGTVTPAWGTTVQKPGQSLTVSALDSFDRDGDGKFIVRCTGYDYYELSGGDWLLEQSGTDSTFTIVSFPEDDARLVWKFSSEIAVEAAATGNGSVSGGGTYALGATAVLTAMPAEGAIFRRWTGLPAGANTLSPTISLSVSDTMSVTAVFENAADAVRYVSTDGSDEAAGTEAAPFASIKHAIESLGETGGYVYVAAGTYEEAPILNEDQTVAGINTVVVSAPVQIIGRTGNPSDVIVKRQNTSKNARVFLLDNAEAALRCLTVRGGKYDNGGNVQITANGGLVEDCILEGGVSSSYMGGGANICLYAGRVNRCVIRNGTGGSNNNGRNGGGFRMDAGVIENSLVYGNTGRYAGGVVTGTSRLVNCTVVGNTFNGAGYSAGIFVTENARVVNCIISGNNNSADTSMTGLVYSLGSKADVNAVLVSCASSDGGVKINDSCFYGPVGFADSANGDYTLSVSSSLRDAGVLAGEYGLSSTTDLAGNDRVLGSAIDIGCYEYLASGLAGDFTISASSFLVPASITLAATVEGATGAVSYKWVMDDGVDAHRQEVTTSDATFEWTCQNAGRYTVTLTATADGNELLIEHALQTSPTALFVAQGNENAAYPYATSETAAPEIPLAIDAAMDGAVIHVAAGSYTNASEVAVEKEIALLGAGRDVTKIVSKAGRTVRITKESAMVANFALEVDNADALLGEGGTVYITGAGGTLSNCLVKCHSVNGWGRGGAGISAQNGCITHCEVFGYGSISTGDMWNNGVAVRLRNNSRMENSLIRDVVSGNIDRNGGHIVSVVSSQIKNCTIVNSKLPDPAAGCGTDHGSGLYVDGNSSAQNCVVCGVKANEITNEIPEGGEKAVVTIVGEMTQICPWSGVAESFGHCATDGESVVNAGCRIVTSDAFKDYANGDYRPASGGPLVDTGVTPEGWRSLVDLAGKSRVKGKAIDIGCYEGNSAGMVIVVR